MRRSSVFMGDLTHVEGDMAREPVYRALQDQSLTRDLTEGQIAKLTALARKVDFEEDQIIFRAGEQSRYLYLVLSGRVCIEISTPVYAVCLQTVGPGQAFGWSSLLDHHDTVFQVRAQERSTALCLDAVQLSAVCQEDPKLGFQLFRRLLDLVARRLQAVESRLGEFCGFRGRSSNAVQPRAVTTVTCNGKGDPIC